MGRYIHNTIIITTIQRYTYTIMSYNNENGDVGKYVLDNKYLLK